MFDLVTWEDRLFSNTILLRLADAFKFDDKRIRLAVVRVFLLELYSRDKARSKQYRGILSKGRVQNHHELLTRVKVVLNGGDPEARSLALILLGCCAHFAKDSAQIRYLILSSLLSSHLSEVSAVYTLFSSQNVIFLMTILVYAVHLSSLYKCPYDERMFKKNFHPFSSLLRVSYLTQHHMSWIQKQIIFSIENKFHK